MRQMCPNGNNPGESSQHCFCYSTLLKSRLTILTAVPAWYQAKPLLVVQMGNSLLYAWTALCQRLLPRRRIGVTCGDSRTPIVGRCSRERRLIRSMGAPNGGALTGSIAW
jgi:hypothetical protein